MLQTAIRNFMMKKFTKSEANLSSLDDTEEEDKLAEEEVANSEVSRQRIVSCPESDQIRNISKGFYSTIIDLKKICEEGL